MSSQKFSAIQSHSMSLGSSSEMSCKSARAPENPSPTRGFPGAGEGLDGLDGQQPFLAVVLHDRLGPPGSDQLGEGVPDGQVPAYAGEVLGVAVRRLEL